MRVLALPGPLFLFPWVPHPFPCPHQTPALQQQRTTSAPPTLAPHALCGAGYEEESWGGQRCEKPPRRGNACGERVVIITPRGGSDPVAFQPLDRAPHLARTQPGLCAAAGLSLQPSQKQPPAPSPGPCPLPGGDPSSAGGCGYVQPWCCVGAFGPASPSPGPTPLGTALPLSRRG